MSGRSRFPVIMMFVVLVFAAAAAAVWIFSQGRDAPDASSPTVSSDSVLPATVTVPSLVSTTVPGSVPPASESFSGVFYVSDTPFPCGPALEDMCTTLEVAPPSSETSLPWIVNANNKEVVGAESTSIGAGYVNTLVLLGDGDGSPSTSAAAYAYAYVFDGKDDWYLPSKDELNELCKKFTNPNPGREPVLTSEGGCTGSFNPSGGFAADYYWSSSRYINQYYTGYLAAWTQHFAAGRQTSYTTKNYQNWGDYAPRVRPVRAF